MNVPDVRACLFLAPDSEEFEERMARIALGVIIVGIIGSVIGCVRKCSTGACPLTATQVRGAVWGGILGILPSILWLGNTRFKLCRESSFARTDRLVVVGWL